MNSIIKSDLFRYQGKTGIKDFLTAYYIEPGFKYSYFLRQVSVHSKFSVVGFISRIFYNKYANRYGYQIPKCVKIGKGFMIKHWGHVVINSKAIIGDNCTILQGVTVGQTNRGNKAGAPTIGDNVYLSPNCVIVGGIYIGDNVLIAPNAYVNFDVPSNSIVVGNPGKIIPKSNATEGYVINPYLLEK